MKPPPDELTRMFARFCDGCISDEEMDRLNTLMEQDPEARRLYRRWVDLEMELWLTTTENVEAASCGRIHGSCCALSLTMGALGCGGRGNRDRAGVVKAIPAEHSSDKR